MRGVRKLLRNREGATMVEFSILAFVILIMTFSVAEFGYAYWQWNSAEKATQMAARAAIVSDPVAVELATFDCGTAATAPGEPCSSPDAASFGTVVCSGADQTCTGGYTFSPTALNALVARVQPIFPRVTAANVVVEYRDIGLGFVTRGAPVPTITVRLVDLTFSFIALNFLTGGPIPMPDFRATLTGEDIRTAGA